MKISKEFNNRRQQLMNMVDEDSIIILPTSLEKNRNNDVFHPFRAGSDFYVFKWF